MPAASTSNPDDSRSLPLPFWMAWMVWMWTLVSNLLALLAKQQVEIGSLKDEIAVLKGLKPCPRA
jgi:hypothetical protein